MAKKTAEITAVESDSKVFFEKEWINQRLNIPKKITGKRNPIPEKPYTGKDHFAI